MDNSQVESFSSPQECVKYLENKYKIKFTKALIGHKSNFNMYNKGWVIGEQTDDEKIRYRIDYDDKIGMHVNYEGFTKEHCLIRTYIIKNQKFEYWNGLHDKYGIPKPI